VAIGAEEKKKWQDGYIAFFLLKLCAAIKTKIHIRKIFSAAF
jgi:hypothetical protein